MTIYDPKMDISITEFKQRCLEIVRHVERTREPVVITRRGRIVARLGPAPVAAVPARPWEQLRKLGGELRGPPGQSVLDEGDFEASR
jgi:prevent-host-death family protein